MTQMSTQLFWGVFREVFGVHSKIWALQVTLFALENGTFCKSARFQVPKNGTSSAQIFEWTPKTSRDTPQNGGVDSWFMRFHFRASIKPIFENQVFRPVFEAFYPLKRPKTKKWLRSLNFGRNGPIFWDSS